MGLGKGFGRQSEPEFNVVAIDYGIKRNILRLLAGEGCKVTVVRRRPRRRHSGDEAGRRIPLERPGDRPRPANTRCL